MNFVDPILHQARMNPDALAVCAPGARLESVSYARLVQIANNVARRALWEGLKRGDTVAIDVSEPVFHAAIVLAMMRLGIVTVSAPPTGLPESLGVAVTLSDTKEAVANGGKTLPVDFGWMDGDGKPAADRSAHPGNDDRCRIELTRGKTGEVKGVAFTHRMIAARNAALQVAESQIALSRRLYCDRGFASRRGFQLLMHTLSKGGAIFFSDGPDTAAQAFGLYEIESLWCDAGRLADYVNFFEAHPEFNLFFRDVTVETAVERSVCERARMRMTSELYLAYGAAEAGTIATAPAHRIERVSGAVGWGAHGVSVEIVDEDGRVLPAGKEGAVRVRSPCTTEGYIGGQGADSFRDGWFYPGDTGYLTDDRLLVIPGSAIPKPVHGV